MPRIAAIGDIHGEIFKLGSLLGKLVPELDPEDTILFVGDYIDRGPDTKGVIDLVLELSKERRLVTLRGNHEQLMLDAYSYFRPAPGDKELDPDYALPWFYNGANQTLASYPKEPNWWNRITEEHWTFIRSTLMEHTEGNYHFVHAGVVPSTVEWTDVDYDPRLWIREPFIQSLEDFGSTVVFGHTHFRNGKPLFMPNKIGIDTAAAYGGPLTAIIVDPDEPYRHEKVMVLQSD